MATKPPPQGKLTTHVLDTALGKPAAGMIVQLYRGFVPGDLKRVKTFQTDEKGRTEMPLLEGKKMKTGWYTLLFFVGAYHRLNKNADGGKFLEHVPIVFQISGVNVNYHIPLLVSPWSYSTYRGS